MRSSSRDLACVASVSATRRSRSGVALPSNRSWLRRSRSSASASSESAARNTPLRFDDRRRAQPRDRLTGLGTGSSAETIMASTSPPAGAATTRICCCGMATMPGNEQVAAAAFALDRQWWRCRRCGCRARRPGSECRPQSAARRRRPPNGGRRREQQQRGPSPAAAAARHVAPICPHPKSHLVQWRRDGAARRAFALPPRIPRRRFVLYGNYCTALLTSALWVRPIVLPALILQGNRRAGLGAARLVADAGLPTSGAVWSDLYADGRDRTPRADAAVRDAHAA